MNFRKETSCWKVKPTFSEDKQIALKIGSFVVLGSK